MKKLKLEDFIKSKPKRDRRAENLERANKNRFDKCKADKEFRVRVIKANPNLKVKRLAEICGCSTITIYNLLKELEESDDS